MNSPFATQRLLRRAGARSRPDAYIWQTLGLLLTERCKLVNRTFARAAVFAPDETFADMLRIARPDWTVTFYSPDAEHLPLAPRSCDAIIMLGLPAMVNDVPGVLTACHTALESGGLFLAAFYGGGSWAELRTVLLQAEAAHSNGAAVRVAPMIDAGTAATLLQRAGFALPVVDHETSTVSYESLRALANDLRAGNANAILTDMRPLPRAAARAAEELYRTQFGDPRPGKEGRLVATLQAIFLSGWRA